MKKLNSAQKVVLTCLDEAPIDFYRWDCYTEWIIKHPISAIAVVTIALPITIVMRMVAEARDCISEVKGIVKDFDEKLYSDWDES